MRLPKYQWMAVVCFISGMTYREIAFSLDVTPQSATNYKRDAVRNLRTQGYMGSGVIDLQKTFAKGLIKLKGV